MDELYLFRFIVNDFFRVVRKAELIGHNSALFWFFGFKSENPLFLINIESCKYKNIADHKID